MRRLVLASSNAHKVGELAAMIAAAGLPLKVLAAREIGSPPTIAEDQGSFVAHAAVKARGIAAWLRARGEPGDTLVLADDSGVCVDALDGAPGVDSAVFAGPAADDAANNRALLQALADRGVERSPAFYLCVLALGRVDAAMMPMMRSAQAGPGPDLALFVARWHGEIRREREGSGGFGYDPYFWIDGPAGPTSAAALAPDEKNQRSHRGQAVRALLAGLAEMAAAGQ